MKTLDLVCHGRYETIELPVTINEKYINPDDVKLVEVLPNLTMTCMVKTVLPDIDIPCNVRVRGYNNTVICSNAVFNNLNDAYDYADLELDCFACYGDGCLEITHAKTGELLVVT